MAEDRLLPLREAAARVGLTAKSVRQRAWRSRAGLGGPRPPFRLLHRDGRIYVSKSDVDRAVAELAAKPANAGPERISAILPKALEAIASEIEAIYPQAADRLRRLASHDDRISRRSTDET